MKPELIAEWNEAGVLAEQAQAGIDEGKRTQRFAKDALRAVFLARYEASQSGSALVEPHHLLMALLRDGRVPNASGLRDEIERAFPVKANWDKVDLRTGDRVKRILDYASEEARYMGVEVTAGHLLLGILREEEAPGAVRFLHDRGMDVVHMRQSLIGHGVSSR